MGPRCFGRRSRFTKPLWDRTARKPDWYESILGGLDVKQYMKEMDRRDFLKAAGLGAGLTACLPGLAQRKRNVKIGHTGITWVQPPPPRTPASDAAPPTPAARGGARRVDPAYIEGIF